MQPATASLGPRALGGYELREKLGEGGMGAVYRARNAATGEWVAVKLLPLQTADFAVRLKRFEREFRAALRLDHPNIVQVLDFGCDGGFHYLVMELVQGQSLGQRLAERGALPEEEAVRIILQVAAALHQAHELKLVHRDVKPDNILLMPTGVAKLTDLGLVKVLDEEIGLTTPGSGLGTPNYMAPEQFDDASHAGPHCDLYALGATLYAAITGQVPFQGSTFLNVIKKKQAGELTPVRLLAPGVSERTERAILRAMSLDPARRHASAEELIAELTASGAGGTASARRESRRAARPASQSPPGPERRVHVREVSSKAGSCLPVGGHREDNWPALVRDVSRGGVGLVLARRFEAGTVLQVWLQAGETATPESLLVRVVNSRHLRPRKWLLGCAFATPLDEDEWKALC
jgi:serine/threonine protein kinase